MSKGQEVSIGLRATRSDESITLHLQAAGSYRIFRKEPSAAEWGQPIWNNHELGLEFVDVNVVEGRVYEYSVRETMTGATGYICAGSKIPLVDQRGKLILIVESTHATALAPELDQFISDLAGDGYEVLPRYIARGASPEYVKEAIKLEWEKDKENVRTVILLGAVPVRMSGPINWDGHGSAMVAADGFYADMTGDWSGSPGIFPAKLDLILGRIDFSNLVCFQNKPNNHRSELDLLRAYLVKNHAWRNGQWSVSRRAAIRDGFSDRDFSSNGWRNFPQMVGTAIDEIPDGQFFSTLKDKDYLIGMACGGGQLVSMAGTGGSDDFANNVIQMPFLLLLGSAFLGNWQVESAFLRSALASGNDEKGCLVAFGAGAPHVFLHRMALGGTIGESFLMSENNFTVYPATGNAEPGLYTPAESTGIPSCVAKVHQALFGDPTLTLFPVKPVTNLTAHVLGPKSIGLGWNQPVGSVGYHVYRSASENGPFQRLTETMIESPAFIVTDHFPGLIYMVRAVALVETPSGSYYAVSCGATWSDSQTPPMPPTPGTIMSKANFIEADTTTKGNWIGTYGSNGRFIASGVKLPPGYASVPEPVGATEYAWSTDSQDVRAIQASIPPSPRIAAAWNATIGFTVDIKSDATAHRLALYFLDFDRQYRSQRVEILDGATGAILDTREVDSFGDGVWLVYDYAGTIKLRLTKLAGPNCVLSAIMFSPSGAVPVPVPNPNTRTLEIQYGPSAAGPWTSKGTVQVESDGEKGFYRLRIL